MKLCPVDGHDLKPAKLLTLQIDQCPDCKGVWLDRDELRLAKDHADPDLNWVDFEIWKHPDLFTVEPRHLKCPQGHSELVAVRYGETKVTVDYCGTCQGVWLDRGEFKRIIDALENEVTSKTASEYINASIQEAKECSADPNHSCPNGET
jgi:Zn-finger nucleic acid-binding protein